MIRDWGLSYNSSLGRWWILPHQGRLRAGTQGMAMALAGFEAEWGDDTWRVIVRLVGVS